MLEDAQDSLRGGDALVALALLRRLDQKYPHGALREERAAAEALALCAADLTEEAKGRGRAFLSKHPASVYTARVRAACGLDAGTSDDGSGTVR